MIDDNWVNDTYCAISMQRCGRLKALKADLARYKRFYDAYMVRDDNSDDPSSREEFYEAWSAIRCAKGETL